MDPDREEPLRQLGVRCAALILDRLEEWQDAGVWLKTLPICQAVAETNDPSHPALEDGRFLWWDANSPNGEFFLYDDEARVSQVWGPIYRRISCGWEAALWKFRRIDGFRFISLKLIDARRIVLLAALTLAADFDGAELGLGWPWEEQKDAGTTFEGRCWAWAKITSGFGSEAALIEVVSTALDHIASLPSPRSVADAAPASQGPLEHADRQSAPEPVPESPNASGPAPASEGAVESVEPSSVPEPAPAPPSVPEPDPAPSPRPPPPERTRAGETGRIGLVWVEDESMLSVGDSIDGTVADVVKGSTGWAFLFVLKQHQDEVLPLNTLAKEVEQAIAMARAESADEARAVLRARGELDGDDRFEASQYVKRGRGIPSYRDVETSKLINRASANIRNATGSGKAVAAWRARWIHWDRKGETVTFGIRR